MKLSEPNDDALEVGSLSPRSFHALAPWAWRFLVVLVVLLAAYVMAGRYLMQQMPLLRDPLLEQINRHLPFEVTVASLAGSWHAFSPELSFTGLSITQVDPTVPPVVIDHGSLRLDVPASLLAGSVQLSRLNIAGLALDARLSEDGAIEIVGFAAGGGGDLRNWLQDFLPNVERVSLGDNSLRLDTPKGSMDLAVDLLLEREGNARHLHGMVVGSGIALELNAEGVGNPLRPRSWAGDVFVDAKSSDLAALSDFWSSLNLPFRLAGSASAQFWLTRERGGSTAKMRWDSTALQLDELDDAWSLPLDALSFEAALEQRARHWSLLTEDFHIERAGQALDLDRAQFDWWGQALRIRASDLSLGALPTLLAAAPGLPQGLRDVLPSLAPAGVLSAVELRLDDLSDPAHSWQLRASVDDLSVNSWRNTPALTGVTGYLELEPGVGQLKLDTGDFSMHFPSVYREPLRYTGALGDVYLNWDGEGLRVGSGLVSLSAQKASASALFAVDVPFSERVTGVELELLIGLQDSSIQDQSKYLPYTLPGPLLGWLDRSVADGQVDRAGFIWRGSTRRRNFPHMSVQLFLDTSQATLTYDPAWPPLSEAVATVWVDDGRTWARVSSAQSEGVEISDLMLRVLPQSPGALVDIAGELAGPASSAGLLLRDSPLRDMTNGVFKDWVFSGSLAGDLSLRLPIGVEAKVPTVGLNLRLQDVSAEIHQLGLAIEQLQGDLRYLTSEGFVGSLLSGQLLGGSIALRTLEGSTTGMDLSLEGDLDTAQIAPWLSQPLLAFARGSTGFSGELFLGEQKESQLHLSSDLLGVTFDAPRPFAKSADQPLSLDLAIPLSPDPVLTLDLGERLNMQLAFAGNTLAKLAASVGGEDADPSSCAQRLCLTGAVSSLDLTQWGDFYRRFAAPREDADLSLPEAFAPVNEGASNSLSYQIDSLDIGELSFASRSFGHARVDLWGVETLWQGAVESSSLQGSLTREDGGLLLLLEYLDLGGFGEGEPLKLAQARATVPSMRVDVLELRSGGQVLGNLGFDLDTQHSDGALYVTDIEGEVWGLQLHEPQPGMLRWSSQGEQEHTTLEMDAAYTDLGTVMSAAGFAPTLESDKGSMSLRLRWPGAPTAFALKSTDGAIKLAASNGRLLESGPGALSMISFLNFAEILRGLSLSHMFESGIPFVTASMELFLERGLLEVADVRIDGAASAFAFTGLSDLELGSINGELLVTLPVANNLPWVAALAAGPAVAAGVFVVSKVFEKQVNRMSSAVYEVSGSIDAPEVKFRRLFDDKLSPRLEAPEDSERDAG